MAGRPACSESAFAHSFTEARTMKTPQKVLLMILDGWGIGKGGKPDAIRAASPAYIDAMTARYPHAMLRTDGEFVGLPEGQMGNSEVGHLNIGAGRVVYQDLVRINRAWREGALGAVPEVKALFEHVKATGAKLHFMGLFSDGGVHASFEHLLAFLALAKAEGVGKTFVHAFMDGRDTDPKSGLGFVKALEKAFEDGSAAGTLASMIGRYYAMDRDKRWERIQLAYDLLTKGFGKKTTNFARSLEASYADGVTDEFVKPLVRVDKAGAPVGRIEEGDAVIFLNFRNDRAKELTTVLTQEAVTYRTTEGSDKTMAPLPLWFATMTPYDAKFTGLHILFNKENVTNTIGEYVARLGLKQLRIAETEKYAHVTFFLNGGREAPYEGEDRILIASPKAATYDLKPEMSAYELADKLADAIALERYDFICINFANGDMVGHTGKYDAIVKAVKAVDECVAKVVEAAKAHGYEVVQVADHGNADNAVNADGSPNTAHSLNPVPIVVVSDRVEKIENGVLADVAPTVLHLMGLPQPEEMTGRSLASIRA